MFIIAFLNLTNVFHISGLDVSDQPVLQELDDVIVNTILGSSDSITDELVVSGLVRFELVVVLLLEELFFSGEVKLNEFEKRRKLGSIILGSSEISDSGEELLVLFVEFVILDVEGSVPLEGFGNREGHFFGRERKAIRRVIRSL